MLNPFKRRAYRRALAEHTPVIEGRAARLVARALRYDTGKLIRLIRDKAVPFGDPKTKKGWEQRLTYPRRVIEWARAGD